QNLQDGFHSDYRRARSAINNIIPTTSSAIKTVQLVLPDMKQVFDGFATRVPVADCSFVELTALLHHEVTPRDIKDAFLKYADGNLKNYLEYCEDPIVSSDINNNSHSAIFDALSTKVIGGNFVQILAWYDNEYGYSSRIVDLIKYIS
ncbi:MAG: type I glyceraldehyde-3-phosphate dehydrogenase, partial [Bacteroidales bacterium]